MSIEIKFASLSDSDLRYVVYQDSMELWDAVYRTAGALSNHIGYYSTLGDGDCQHTPVSPATIANFEDFCASAAAHLLDVPEDRASVDDALSLSGSRVNRADVEFLTRKVIYRDGAARYYNMSDRKVSTADSKRHDKRWERITSSDDGSYSRVACHLYKDFFHVLTHYAMLCDLRDIYYDLTNTFGEAPARRLKICADDESASFNQADAAFRMLRHVLKSYAEENMARRCMETWKYNHDLAISRATAACVA